MKKEKTLEECKDEAAGIAGYENWKDYMQHIGTSAAKMNEMWEESMKLFTSQPQCKKDEAVSNEKQTPEKALRHFIIKNVVPGAYEILKELEYYRKHNFELLEALEEAYNERAGNISSLKWNASERTEKYKVLIQKHKEK